MASDPLAAGMSGTNGMSGMTGMTGTGSTDDPMHTMTGLMWMPEQPMTLARLFALHPQPVPILPVFGLLLLAGYLLGMLLLHRRGDRWPVSRLVWWLLGVVTVELMTATAFDGYGMEFFSIHMLQHMTLGMLTPILLCLGAPMTLLLRVLPAKHPGERSARGLLLAVIHSRAIQVIANPMTTVVLFLLSLYALYFTPLFDYLMSRMWGHNLMLLHFIAIGMLYFWGVLGVDPSPRRGGGFMGAFGRPVLRLGELAATIPFHAFFGVVLMMASTVITPYYAHPVAWATSSALSDQQTAGGIAWGFTELPTLLVLGVLFWQWQRSDARHARSAAHRERIYGDTALEDYNARLAALAARDGTGPR